jgi:hypothetical protein
MPKQNLNPEILAAALEGLEAQRARLDAHIAQTRRLLGTRPQEPAAAAETPRPKRKMSAAARKRISIATRKRWAEHHRKLAAAAQSSKPPAAVAKPPRRKRKMSAAARKRISDATRKRWAEYRRKKEEAQAAPKKPAAKAPVKAAKRTAKKTAAKGPKTAVAMAATAEGAPE